MRYATTYCDVLRWSLSFAPHTAHRMERVIMPIGLAERRARQTLVPARYEDTPEKQPPKPPPGEKDPPIPTDVPVPEPLDVPVPEPTDVPVPEPEDVPPPGPRDVPPRQAGAPNDRRPRSVP